MKKIVAIFLMVALAISALATLVACLPEQPIHPQYFTGTVTLESGTIQGLVDQNVAVFKGIPYAKAPVGDLRWRAPQPVESWEGTLDCTLWGANAAI